LRRGKATGIRLVASAVLVIVVGIPVILPWIDLARTPRAWSVWSEHSRLASLLEATVLLVAGTIAIALPIGIWLAVVVFRSTWRWHRLARWALALCLFIPVPLTTSAWQVTVGDAGWLPIGTWSHTPGAAATRVWHPWMQGLPAAIWIHGLTAIPWVVWLVGHGLSWVEPELEEEELTQSRLTSVWRRITLPRARGVIGATAVWIGVQAATDISVTDVVNVRTFAEEVYTQMVTGDTAAVQRALAAAAPLCIGCLLALLVVATWLKRSLPPLNTLAATPFRFQARWFPRGVIGVGAALIVLAFFVPLGSLLWKLGSTDGGWSGPVAALHLNHVVMAWSSMILASVLCALVAGILVATMSLALAILSLDSTWFGWLTASLLALAIAIPGPIVGMGLNTTIQRILELTSLLPTPFRPIHGFLEVVLYDGPSYVPIVWINVVRFLPYACILMWPVARLYPRELRELARLDGFSLWSEFRFAIGPYLFPIALEAGAAVMALSLGELSAGKLVETAGAPTLAHELFNQMHYGVTNDLAAMGLILLAAVIAFALALSVAGRWARRRERQFAA
jgi:iron(III) transport system permease protein